MSSNSNINSLIENIKNLQKKYIKSNYDSDIKLELDKLNEELNNIPIYITYTEYLDRVNEMISYVNDELSDYFYNILNIYEQYKSNFMFDFFIFLMILILLIFHYMHNR